MPEREPHPSTPWPVGDANTPAPKVAFRVVHVRRTAAAPLNSRVVIAWLPGRLRMTLKFLAIVADLGA